MKHSIPIRIAAPLIGVLFAIGCQSQPTHQAARPAPTSPAKVPHSHGGIVNGQNPPSSQSKNNQAAMHNLVKETRKMTPQERREFGQFLDSQSLIAPPKLKRELQRN